MDTKASKKYFIAFVGLPACGKSYLANKLNAFFTLMDLGSSVFNLGSYRRKYSSEKFDASYFSADNKTAKDERERYASMALDDALKFLESPEKHIVLYDGTNVTLERRSFLRSRLAMHNLNVVWVEMVCASEPIVYSNIVASKLGLSDYEAVEDKSQAFDDFLQRISEYKAVYVPISQEEVHDNCNEAFIRIYNLGEHIEYYNAQAFDLDALYLRPYLSRVYQKKTTYALTVRAHPESINNHYPLDRGDANGQCENGSFAGASLESPGQIALTDDDVGNPATRRQKLLSLISTSSTQVAVTSPPGVFSDHLEKAFTFVNPSVDK